MHRQLVSNGVSLSEVDTIRCLTKTYFVMKKAALIITDLLLKLLHKRSSVTKFIQIKQFGATFNFPLKTIKEGINNTANTKGSTDGQI